MVDPKLSTEDHAGHRARLRNRLVTAGGEALADHELIEYLLALAIPRRDTKPIAKRLLKEFGGIGPLVAADPESLERVPDVGATAASAIKLIDALVQRVLHGAVIDKVVLGNWQGLLDYLRGSMAHHINEQVRVLHLNTKNELTRDEVMSEGSIDQASIHVREVVRRAIELGSAALIIAHNHPSGDPAPSAADIRVTRELIAACTPLGIVIHDHVIIGAKGHASMKTLGLI